MKAKVKDPMIVKLPNCSPLPEREKKMDTRKGMTKVQETVNINWAEKEQLIFPEYESTH